MSELLTADHRAKIRQLAKDGVNAPVRRRAEILLLYDQGLKTQQVAERMSQTPHTVLRWRREYRRDKMDVFPSRALAAISGVEEESRSLFDDSVKDDVSVEDDVAETAFDEQPREEAAGPVESPDAELEEEGAEAAPALVLTRDGMPTLDSLLAKVQAAGPHSVIVVVQQAAKKKKKKARKAAAKGKKTPKKGSGKDDTKRMGKKKKKAGKKKATKKGTKKTQKKGRKKGKK